VDCQSLHPQWVHQVVAPIMVSEEARQDRHHIARITVWRLHVVV
jgi:hypothetical protein